MLKKVKVVMLPTNEKAILWLTPANKLRTSILEAQPLYGKRELGWIGLHLYLTSDEKIKKGDWKLNIFMNPLKPDISDADYDSTWANKIIATTDPLLFRANSIGNDGFMFDESSTIKPLLPHPSQGFIDIFVKSYNANAPIKEVMVQYEQNKYPDLHGVAFDLKVNQKDNTITIMPANRFPKNREELKPLLIDFASQWQMGEILGENGIKRWMDENL